MDPKHFEQPTPQVMTDQSNNYEFILNPPAKHRWTFSPSDLGPLKLIIAAVIVLLLLIIIISVGKSLLAGKSNVPALINVTQDQQEIIHLATAAQQQSGLSVANQNLAITSQLSITSAQNDMLTYLVKLGKKVKPKTLQLKVDPILDSQLTAAVNSNTYDTAFHQAMQTKLTGYQLALKQAYAQTKGPNGRAMLSRQYNDANLLLVMLKQP